MLNVSLQPELVVIVCHSVFLIHALHVSISLLHACHSVQHCVAHIYALKTYRVSVNSQVHSIGNEYIASG